MKNLLYYFLKEFISVLFFLAGGVWLLKKVCSGRSVLVVLNYHNFSKYNNYKIRRGSILETGYAKNFEKQVRFLKKFFSFSSPDEFFGSDAPKGINILLTFDDGYKDNYDIAFPVLKRYNIPSIFFISTGLTGTGEYLLHDKIRYLVPAKLLPVKYIALPVEINRGEKDYRWEDTELINRIFSAANVTRRIMMNKEEISDLHKNGFIIGNHTHTHAGLSFLSAEEQENEILKSNNLIETITGKKVRHIAYPNGLANSETYDILKKTGIEYGFKMTGGGNSTNSSRYELNRIGINASDSVSFLLLKIFFHTALKRRPSNLNPSFGMDIKSKIGQYGPANSIKRLVKYIFRKLRISFESFWYMAGTIDIEDVRNKMVKYSFSDVRELAFSDFEHADPKEFNDEKLKVIRGRFERGKYRSYGIFDNSELVYSCWITTSVISYPNNVPKKTALSANEGFLEDAYCHPGYRGRGYHTKMNLFRLYNLYEKKKTRAIGIVLTENLPALRSLERIGFKREKKITFLNILGRQYYIEKL